MDKREYKAALAALAAVGMLAGCGGGGSASSAGNANGNGNGAGGMDAFTGYVASLLSSSPDNTEPQQVDTVAPSTPDNTEPATVH